MKKVLIALGVIAVAVGGYFAWQSFHPGQSNLAGPGEHCGGNMTTAKSCTSGYHCAPEPGSHLPFGDVGGICVSDTTPTPKPTSSCIPRPACLDSTPRCLPPEPIGGWCQTPTPVIKSYY